jgi:hypothetical protein
MVRRKDARNYILEQLAAFVKLKELGADPGRLLVVELITAAEEWGLDDLVPRLLQLFN